MDVSTLAGIAGIVLVLAGVVWVFLAATNVIKEAEAQTTRLQAQGPEFDLGDVLKQFLAWLKENLPKKLLPGFALIVAGLIAFGVALATGGSDGGDADDTPSPTPAAASVSMSSPLDEGRPFALGVAAPQISRMRDH